MLRKSLLLGLSIHLAPALAGPLSSRAGPSEFELGDPYYLCLRGDGSIDRGAEATCNGGSSAAKLNDIREGSTGDLEFFYVDESFPSRNHILRLDCEGGDSPPTTVTEVVTDTIVEPTSITITQFETNTVTEILPPATVTATVTEACSGSDYYDNDGYGGTGDDGDGYGGNGYNGNGYNGNGYNGNGYNGNGYGGNGYNGNGYGGNGYNGNGYGGNGYNNYGFTGNGYANNGY